MNIEKECINERLKLIEDTLEIIKDFQEEALETIENLVLQKVTLKKKLWCDKNINIEQIKCHSEYITEMLNYTSHKNVQFAKSSSEILCPFSKRPIQEEYKAECGHTMERNSAIQIFKQGKGKGKCPVIGCNRILKNPQ